MIVHTEILYKVPGIKGKILNVFFVVLKILEKSATWSVVTLIIWYWPWVKDGRDKWRLSTLEFVMWIFWGIGDPEMEFRKIL